MTVPALVLATVPALSAVVLAALEGPERQQASELVLKVVSLTI